MEFDAKRASLRGPNQFKPFNVSGNGVPLSSAGLEADTPLMVVERGGRKLALLLRQMVYHHLAQGELAGQPYMVTF